MKKLISAAAFALTLTFAAAAMAHMHEGNGPHFMENAINKLPPQKAREFRDTMKDAKEENKELFRQMEQAHKELHAILVAPKFDQDAYLDKSKELRDLHEQMEANMNESFTTAVSKLNQNERMTLVRSMHEGMEHKHWKQHHASNGKTGEYPKPQNENGPVSQ